MEVGKIIKHRDRLDHLINSSTVTCYGDSIVVGVYGMQPYGWWWAALWVGREAQYEGIIVIEYKLICNTNGQSTWC